MTGIEPNKTVGQLVAERPSRARIFERFGINFFCGQKIPPSSACAERELDTEKIVAALREADSNAAETDEPDWTGAGLTELAEVRRTYNGLHGELEAHMMKEEQIQFPLSKAMETSQSLEAGHCGSVNDPIHRMGHEHDSAGAALACIRSLTGDFTPPEDACNTYRALLDALAELEADLHRHIHNEDSILFPRAS